MAQDPIFLISIILIIINLISLIWVFFNILKITKERDAEKEVLNNIIVDINSIKQDLKMLH